MIVKTENLTKRYGSSIVLDSINISVPKNSVYGLLGLNGAGKSTTIRILSTLTKPSAGEVYIGRYLLAKQKNEIRDIIGLMPQDSQLPQNKTVRFILDYYAMLKGVSIKDWKVEKMLSLQKYEHMRISDLSHGIQKLVAIAQAFIGDPSLIMLDEPLGGLDPNYRALVRKLIIHMKTKTTIILSTHLMNEAEILCTHIGIIHKGKLILQDDVKKVKKLDNILTFKVSNPTDALIASLQKIKGVLSVDFNDGSLKIETSEDFSKKIIPYLAGKVDIISMHRGLTIEEIFLSAVKD